MPWLMRQGTVDVFTCGGANASFLAQHINGSLALEESLLNSLRVGVAIILSVDEALCDLGLFAFVALHLISLCWIHLSAIVELL